MYRSLILFALICISIPSQAGIFVGLGGAGRLVKNDENNFKTKFPVSVYGGYRNLPWAYALEGLYYKDSSSTGASFDIDKKHYEISAYVLRFFNYEEARFVNPYAVGGLGTFQERVEGNFLGTPYKDKSDLNTVLKIGAGAWSQLGSMGFLNVEAKALYSKDLSPELLFEIAARAGLEF